MEYQKQISIVIVNYNVKDFILQCLKSIELATQNLSVETIVVDNNSQDGSVEYLQSIFPTVVFLSQSQNLGFSKANNIGFRASKGKYILILNPDTLLNEDTLVKMFNFMEQRSEVGIAGCKVLNPDNTFQLACRRGFPTPWTAFCKLFGLQALFPTSSIFAKYNQTFRSIDETYEIDAVIGAFMFARADLIHNLNGFDEDFFMYGEDLDLCYRVQKANFKVMYYHETSIVHFKGESTKRSSINEVKHFYSAMEIFAAKHFANSKLLLMMLRMGIFLRSKLAYIFKFKRDFLFIASDLLLINAIILLSTKMRRGEFFAFPDFAYPTVFIVISAVSFFSIFSVGEYFEAKPNIRKLVAAQLISFFVLSSLTYFFNEWAFSRGIVLMIMAFSMMILSLTRILYNIRDRRSHQSSNNKIILVGDIFKIEDLAKHINDESGTILIGNIYENYTHNDKITSLGSLQYAVKIILEYKPDEVIIQDKKNLSKEIQKNMDYFISNGIQILEASNYNELKIARVVQKFANITSSHQKLKLSLPRYKSLKRIVDLFAGILLFLLLPIIAVLKKNPSEILSQITKLLAGKISLVGFYNSKNTDFAEYGKEGIISLAEISQLDTRNKEQIHSLNNYYLKNYNIALDFEIMLKYMTRK